jgi:hypothetical protein
MLAYYSSTVPAASYEPAAFIQCLTSTASTSENAVFRIGLINYIVSLTTNPAAEFKAASDIRFEVSDDPDDGACKRILEDHLIWSPSQPLSRLLSASSSRAATEHSAEERRRTGELG